MHYVHCISESSLSRLLHFVTRVGLLQSQYCYSTFFMVLFIAPHLSWERSPLPFIFREAILMLSRLHLGWVRVDLGSFLNLCGASSCRLYSGPWLLIWASVPLVWFISAGLFTVCSAVSRRRACPVPPPWWVLAGSLLLWTLGPVSLGGEFLMSPVPAVLGEFGPGSISGECNQYGIATLPS